MIENLVLLHKENKFRNYIVYYFSITLSSNLVCQAEVWETKGQSRLDLACLSANVKNESFDKSDLLTNIICLYPTFRLRHATKPYTIYS